MSVEHLVRSVYPKLMPYTSGLADYTVEEIKIVLNKEKVYKLSFNENPLGPSPKAVEEMNIAIQSLNLYPNSPGIKLKEKIAQKEGLSSENIVLANGADDMILLIAQTFLEPTDEVIIPEVTFIQFLASTHLMGANPIMSPMKDDLGIDLDAILTRINKKTKLIFLCNPNNPTGKVIPRKELDAFIDNVPSHVLVVIDEAYHEYGDVGEYETSVPFVKQNKQVLIVRTFSKIYSLAAARIGYGIGSVELIEAINHVRPPFNVNSIAQVGALASMNDLAYIQHAKTVNEEGKQYFYDVFSELGLRYIKSNGNFVFVDTGIKNKEAFHYLASEHGVIVRDLSGYGLETSLRVSIGNQEANEAFVLAIKQLMKTNKLEERIK
ncbi:histidinol-phosphate aminotransferase [Salirhabdus euzebyi]|uniref:Histidinol-phosphate aminotransferase n=1 Tax=Salirhabdus euzebyi TaxID=394506 RepID=A0A841Q5T2_9BACI|nr:histidinol-phosphate transaminase [Salirhabdus euzebyi]MBB6453766.1 histidinol-phosphate aminotransferase [Salirhabdus euzebyi]